MGWEDFEEFCIDCLRCGFAGLAILVLIVASPVLIPCAALGYILRKTGLVDF